MIHRLLNILYEKKINFQIFFKKRKILSSNQKLKNIQIDYETKQKYKKLWRSFGNPSFDWLKIYGGINKNISCYYVPENYYYTSIEPRLNNKIYSLAYADKNFYEKIASEFIDLFPKAYLRRINGELYDEVFNSIDFEKAKKIFKEIGSDYLIVKPSSESAGGRGLKLLEKSNMNWTYSNKNYGFDLLIKDYPRNFIIQNKISQHKFFEKFNRSSVNTVRMFSYRSVLNNDIKILHSVLRVGKPGSIVDNQASGGLSIGINNEGILNNFAVNKYGQKFNQVNDKELFDKNLVPQFNSMKTYSSSIAKKFPYNRLLAFDFCVEQNSDIKLLEINLQNIEINFLQMNNGPLFGSYTDEIIEFCKNSPKSVNFDFYV